MKNFTRLLCIFITPFAFQMCSKQEEGFAPGKVEFALSVQENETSTGRTADIPSGTHLLVSIESSRGTTIYTRHRLELLTAGGQFISHPLELPHGNYLLTEFLLASPDNEIIYATPKTGSSLAPAVQFPLPIPFSVSNNELLNLNIQVIDVRTRVPEEFGYVSFRVDTVHIRELQLTVFTNGNNGPEIASGEAFILKGRDTVHTYSLAAKVNNIFFTENPDEEFKLVVIKDGYSRYAIDFSYNQLVIELGERPLTVMLDPALTMVGLVPGYCAPETCPFQIDIVSRSGGEITIDWGDGVIESGSLREDGEFLTHAYSDGGRYFISITGDISRITDFYSYYGMGPLDRINLDHLTELIDLRIGLTHSPSSIDLTHNKKLELINMAGCVNLEEILLAPDNRILFMGIEGPNNIGTAAIDNIIDKLYQSVLADGRRNGGFSFPVAWYEETNVMVGPPSYFSLFKLDELTDNYEWTIYPDHRNPI